MKSDAKDIKPQRSFKMDKGKFNSSIKIIDINRKQSFSTPNIYKDEKSKLENAC